MYVVLLGLTTQYRSIADGGLGEVQRAVDESRESLFTPFADSLRVLNDILYQEVKSLQESVKLPEKVLLKRKKTAIIIAKDVSKEADHPRDEDGQLLLREKSILPASRSL